MTSPSSSEITDAVVDSVMHDLLAPQVAIVRSLRPDVQGTYFEAMRNHVRAALERALGR